VCVPGIESLNDVLIDMRSTLGNTFEINDFRKTLQRIYQLVFLMKIIPILQIGAGKGRDKKIVCYIDHIATPDLCLVLSFDKIKNML